MSASVPQLSGPSFGTSSAGESRQDAGVFSVVLLVLTFLTFIVAANSTPVVQRGATAAGFILLLLPLLWMAPRLGLTAIVVFLCTIGGIRRFLIPIFGWAENDPLLLVGPALSVISFANLVIKRRVRPTTKLGKWVMALLLIMAVQVVNPLQGSLFVGVVGFLFYITPLLWYYIGRDTGTVRIAETLGKTIIVIALLSAVVAYKQTFFGFSEAELQWFKLSEFTLKVGGTERGFAHFGSFAEYTAFLSIGVVVCFSYVLKKQKLAVAPMLFLFSAMFIASSRGAVFGTVGACVFMWAVQGRNRNVWLPRVIVAALLIAVGGVVSLRSISTDNLSRQSRDLVEHQVDGLTNPLGKKSTGGAHLSLIWLGIWEGIKMPLGHGLGSTTRGGVRTGDTQFNAEADHATLFYALGMPGGVVFLGVIFLTLRGTVMYWHRTRSHTPLMMLGIFIVSINNWLTPGHYAQGPFVLLFVGMLDRLWQDRRTLPPVKRAAANSGNRAEEAPSEEGSHRNAVAAKTRRISPSEARAAAARQKEMQD